MDEYVAIDNISMKIDCNFNAKEISTVKTNSVFKKLFTVGPWLKIKYNDKEGWIYPFNKSNEFLIEENKDTGLKLGDAVVINSKKEQVRDEYGKSIIVKKDNTPSYFVITEILSNPKIIKIKDVHGGFYWVKPKMIEKAKIEGTHSKNANMITSLLSTVYNTIFGIDPSVGTNSTTAVDNYDVYKQIDAQQQSLIESAMRIIGSAGINEDDNISWDSAKTRLTSFQLDNIRTIFGMPYQYLPIADMRFSYNKSSIDGAVYNSPDTIKALGIKYAEKIVARMPLLIMVPGVADFMAGFSAGEREYMLKEMAGTISSDKNVDSFINNFTTTMKGTRASFYNMYPAWSEYYRYVDPLCCAAAHFMGLQDIRLPGSSRTLGTMSWREALKNNVLNEVSTYKNACAFYVQSDNQVSESISNGTTQSALASKVNSVADQGRELMFLSSSVDGMLEKAVRSARGVAQSLTSVGQSAANTATSAVADNELVRRFEQSGGAFHAILDGINNTIAGAKMLFPELWQDSQFTRNYHFKVKLDSPDNDPLSLYLNIVVPLIHLICFAAPRNMGPTTYASPFLVKAFYQGFFNINMGIISDMSINKGAEGSWTLKNIPTVVEVEVDVKDLFSNNLTISKSQNLDLNLITNTPLLDYVANLCGVNINEPDYRKLLELYLILAKHKASNYLPNLFARVTNWVNAGKNSVYESFLAGNFNPLRNIR
ncbi:MAG: hypothetical protein IJ193_00225 [Bacilli bacterium]|nr:hypothetical protein [Bacilli bacterium]